MPDYTADQIVTYKHGQPYIQFGDARPDHVVVYAALGGQPVRVEGVSDPSRAAWTRFLRRSRAGPARFCRSANRSPRPIRPRRRWCSWRSIVLSRAELARLGYLTTYVHYGPCKDLSDRASGWEDYIEVLAHGRVTDKDLGTRTAWGDSDDPHEDSVTLRLEDYFLIGSLNFGEKAGPEVEREVLSLTFVTNTDCVACDTPEVYTDRLYALTKSSGAASPGTPAEVIYTTDGGQTWSQVNITGLGTTVNPDRIRAVGTSWWWWWPRRAATTYAPLNQLTGVPGTWTLVTTGFVAAKQPNDMFVLSPNEVFFVGEGGYIYKSTDITAGVTAINAGVATTSDLKRIHGARDTLLAVGESGAIVRSKNRGNTWATATLSPTSATVRAVSVLTERLFWIGTSGGKVYWTPNGGESWTEFNTNLRRLSRGRRH